MKVLYYDCFSGISGDMNLGVLIDLGVDPDYLQRELLKLGLTGYQMKVKSAQRKGITGTRVEIVLDDSHHHNHNHNHNHTHHHEHEHHHTEKDRNLEDIIKIILKSDVSEYVKTTSLAIFQKIAEAEAKIHGKTIDEIHFHEVGAVDSIVDIVGAAVCLDYLKPEKIMSSTIELGGGFVECAHGTFPVPAPATIEILKQFPVKSGAVNFETTTPTGAAILATCADEFTDHFRGEIQKIGYGIGYKDFDIPNVLRVYMGEIKEESTHSSSAVMIECNIDDMNPEGTEYLIDKMLKTGANDVFITPIIMKKSRPAFKISALCSKEDELAITTLFLKETPTLGIRRYEVEKTMLQRTIETVEITYGKVRIKHAMYDGKILKSKAEYEDCLKIAQEHNLPLAEVYALVEETRKKQ
jgi:pyridinium-3,5-bisthiocarboxylic acid mononucleotide nickel chelatase